MSGIGKPSETVGRKANGVKFRYQRDRPAGLLTKKMCPYSDHGLRVKTLEAKKGRDMKKRSIRILFWALTAGFLSLSGASAASEENILADPGYSFAQINLNHPEKSTPIIIPIEHRQSAAYQWRAVQKIMVSAHVLRVDGTKKVLKDRDGNQTWEVLLDANGRGELRLQPAPESFSGRVVIKAQDKTLFSPTPYLSEWMGRTVEKIYEYSFPDGASIRVHFTDQLLEEGGQEPFFPKQVLDAAVSAYQTITQLEGFNSKGYSFASADKEYAYDPDKTLDVYLGNPAEKNLFSYHGFNAAAFKNSPCFDTVKVSETGYHAVILLPINYKDFIKNWERMNPSPLGARNVDVDLRGTLIHEMLHTVLFYYNRNLEKGTGGVVKVDWYVEGLARYFETLAGARHDFYSQGFKQVLPDKVRFSRGGSNYFMHYPNQAFTALRYENALFWRFMDHRFGMQAIERLSREFRSYDPENFKWVLEKVTRQPFTELLKSFSMAILLKDFGLKEDSVYLKEVARTRLVYRDGSFFLKDGFGAEKNLGKVCETDWIGEWDGERARLGEAPVGGENTDKSDVSGWSTDFYEIEVESSAKALPNLDVLQSQTDPPLAVQILPVSDKKIYVLVTNPDPAKTIDYSLRIKP